MIKLLTLTFMIVAILCGCSAQQKRQEMSLMGTSWQLVAIQSMDDVQGTTRIDDPARLTLQFGKNGRASLQLDCNRGFGKYEAKPFNDGSSGTLIFGPIAATRAMCPPPHLGERLIRDLAYVRGFLLKDGKLFLTLMADGGIYEWVPLP